MNRSSRLLRRRAIRDVPKHLVLWTLLLAELFPLYLMLIGSFKTNAGFMQHPSALGPLSSLTLENWGFAARLIVPYLANTVWVAGTSTLLTLGCALLAAYFFARYRLPGSGVLWTLFMVLMLMPTIANLVPLFMLLKSLSLLNTLSALIAVGTAGAQVFNLFVLRAFIEELPRDVFEAAELDGASHLQQVRHIVLPLTAPVLGTLGLVVFLERWNDFLLPLLILRDPGQFTLGVRLIYLDGEYAKHWGHVMAAYCVASLPLILLFLCAMRLFVRSLSQGAVKG